MIKCYSNKLVAMLLSVMTSKKYIMERMVTLISLQFRAYRLLCLMESVLVFLVLMALAKALLSAWFVIRSLYMINYLSSTTHA